MSLLKLAEPINAHRLTVFFLSTHPVLTPMIFIRPLALAQVLSIASIFVLFDGVSADERRDNATMTRLFTPVAESVKSSVAQVLSGGRPVALATIVSSDGYLLTKRSELSNDPIRVRLSDNRMYPARVAAVRRQNDLALLRVDANISLQAITFTDTTPLIASFLVSTGRTGRPIGIGVLGVPARRIEKDAILGVRLRNNDQGRPIVRDVIPNSGAESAGIVPGDLIIAINGRRESSANSVISKLKEMFPGENVRLTIERSTELTGLQTLEMDAKIHDLGVLRESENDSRVNGPRNVRLNGFERVIQHDTVLDPDECGGPLLDTDGNVIGINIARAGRVVSYALPSSLVMRELEDMLREARGSQ
ncbi:PDZ domain-containing protein [Rubripirellula amarantea]|uniref:Serine endoprotease n=1 Tax=Rubripirellula amarantea TaxID=2527999 RepID=A0A5C5WIW8_9BACT|nr:PDZ domain-containing protein [Rubripirellula amarantea]MDA8743694.1 PDZ domain-containing protein [Rubripirellula amarantea]TWT49772.1 serine endoprotease [Rubripirellula amarantea]